MNDKTLDELNDMAKRWIDGEVNHLEVVSLKLFDRLLVLEHNTGQCIMFLSVS